tara:strand:+ start:736 stop:876 length:141 start_codon:yes stop_codon:yes gene_type:complete
MNIDEIEDLVFWNLSFNVKIEDTLKEIKRLDLLEYFTYEEVKKEII